MPSMAGKIVMVTGATNGIGKETARELARMGATTIIVGRDAAKGERVVGELQQDTGNSAIEFMLADLSLMADVRALAAGFRSKYDRLDVLVNNAGTVNQQRQVTPEGFEKSWALNHLSYFLLTNLLLDTLRQSTPARIVNVASSGHKGGRIDFSNLQAEGRYNGFRQYENTKLANILFTLELARRLDGSGVTANSVHPGLVTASFGLGKDLASRLFLLAVKPFDKTPAQGAQTSIYLASSPEVEGVSGKYFVNCRPASTSKAAQDAEVARRLWDISAQQTDLAAVV